MLVSPAKWPDPYEAAHLRVEQQFPLYGDGSGSSFSSIQTDVYSKIVSSSWKKSTNAAENVYCQCWSSNSESDAMWKIYSTPDYIGVKVRVRTQALLTSLIDSCEDHNVFLGKVDYFSQAELDVELANTSENLNFKCGRTGILDSRVKLLLVPY